MRTSTSSYIVELPLRVNDQQNRFLEKAQGERIRMLAL